MTDVAVRTIAPGDHARVGRVIVGAYDATGPFSDDYRTFLGDPARWVAGSSEVFVAERGGEVVGAVAFVLPGDDEFEGGGAGDSGFRFLAVDPAAQGSGAGRALVRACVGAARERGSRRMVIHSMEFMTSAHRLYLREGFDRRPDLDVMFPSGVGYGFTLDLVDDAAASFPPPGPVPEEPPWYEDAWAADHGCF